jgi:hypothetical protein
MDWLEALGNPSPAQLKRDHCQRNALMDETSFQLSKWTWPVSDHLLPLATFSLREWTEHKGDSPITLAFSRTPRRRGRSPHPAFLLKKGASAIGERTYYHLARYLDLPSAVVTWTDYAEIPVAAIRFEPAAWRPDKIDTESGTAISENRVELLANPLDYYRHLALCYAMDEADDTEFMVREDVLFRIDAASVGDALWSAVVSALSRDLSGKEPGDGGSQRHDSISWVGERLRSSEPQGYAIYMETLARIVSHPEWDEVIERDLRTCPATDFYMTWQHPSIRDLSSSQQAYMASWLAAPLMDHVANAFVQRMAERRAVMQVLLSKAD